MAANTNPAFPKGPRTEGVTIVNADGTAFEDCVVAGAEGTRIDQLIVTTDETVANVLQFAIKKGAGADMPIGEVDVPAGSGTAGTGSPTVNVLEAFGPWLDSRGCLFLGPTAVLRVRAKTAVAAAKTTNVIAAATGDF